MTIGKGFRVTQQDVQDNERLQTILNILADSIKVLERKAGLVSTPPEEEEPKEEEDEDEDEDDDEDDDEDEEEEED